MRELAWLRRYELNLGLATLAAFPPADLAAHRAAAVAAVGPLAVDEDVRLRPAALFALAAVPGVDAAVFLAAAADPDPRVRAAAARGLAAFPGDPAARAALAAALGDAYATVRLPAVRAWRAAGFAETELEPLREDPNPAVRLAAGGE